MFDQHQKYYSQKSSYSIVLHRKTHPALLVAKTSQNHHHQ
jgi:hypothetical protein